MPNFLAMVPAYDYYINKSYQSLISISSSFEESFPNNFDSYKSLYEKLYSNDLCTGDNRLNCKDLAIIIILIFIFIVTCSSSINTILSKGATTAIYLLLTNSHQLYISQKAVVTFDDTAAKGLIQSTRMTQAGN